jgi:hypothetical protein
MTSEQVCNAFARLVIVIAVILLILAFYLQALAFLVGGLLLVAVAGWIFCANNSSSHAGQKGDEVLRVEHYTGPGDGTGRTVCTSSGCYQIGDTEAASPNFIPAPGTGQYYKRKTRRQARY